METNVFLREISGLAYTFLKRDRISLKYRIFFTTEILTYNKIILKHTIRFLFFIFLASDDVHCFRKLHCYITLLDPATRIAISPVEARPCIPQKRRISVCTLFGSTVRTGKQCEGKKFNLCVPGVHLRNHFCFCLYTLIR